MSDMKTHATDASVDEFLRSIPDEARRQDCLRVLESQAHQADVRRYLTLPRAFMQATGGAQWQ
jgi:hypothetical protein